jgi:hypothetical protein
MTSNTSTITPTLTPTSFLTQSQTHLPLKSPSETDTTLTSTSSKICSDAASILSDTSSTVSSQTIIPELWTDVSTPHPLPPKKKFNREEYQRNYMREWSKRKRAKVKELIAKQGEELSELKEKLENRFDEPIPFTLLGKTTALTVKELSDFIEKLNTLVESRYENHLRKLPVSNQRGFHALPPIEQMLLILSS